MSNCYSSSAALKRFGLLMTSCTALVTAGCATKETASLPATAPAQAIGLQEMCTGTAIQAIADTLPVKVTVGKIADIPGPIFADGTRYFPIAGDMPAFCQVTGSFVTNPETGKTANFLATLPADWNGKYLQLGCAGHCGTFAVS